MRACMARTLTAEKLICRTMNLTTFIRIHLIKRRRSYLGYVNRKIRLRWNFLGGVVILIGCTNIGLNVGHAATELPSQPSAVYRTPARTYMETINSTSWAGV